MRPYDVVLWDLDGTVMDSAPGIYLSFEHTFARMGLTAPSRAELRRYLGPPLKSTFGEILGFSAEDTARAIALYRDEYHSVGAFAAEPFPGVVDLIEDVRAAGMVTALATSKAEKAARLVTGHFHLDHLFDVYGCATDDDVRKTKSDVLDFVLAELGERGTDRSRIVLVGDRIHDVDGAQEFGVDCVLVEWGYGSSVEFAEATGSVTTVSELREFLGL
ncbi:MAG: HAD hydrolase-like protein [Microbacteriaceae bacterium]